MQSHTIVHRFWLTFTLVFCHLYDLLQNRVMSPRRYRIGQKGNHCCSSSLSLCRPTKQRIEQKKICREIRSLFNRISSFRRLKIFPSSLCNYAIFSQVDHSSSRLRIILSDSFAEGDIEIRDCSKVRRVRVSV